MTRSIITSMKNSSSFELIVHETSVLQLTFPLNLYQGGHEGNDSASVRPVCFIAVMLCQAR